MKPDWDKLTAEYEGSETVLIADVDCTAGGQTKCNEVGIKGYPTIKYGDPGDLQEYKGGRSYDDFKKFASSLGPSCGPAHMDLCDDEKKTEITKLQAMEPAEREALIKEKEATLEKLEADFKAFIEGLNKQYQEASKNKDAAIEEIKSSGLGMLKSVTAFETKKEEGKTDL
mmetsp:Transcript_38966/g.77362  ORF Transcript_38966/g.77362 Transcript_38966/m.77362 type:complete len:171 (+) Transcript_38966:234-746(+)